MSIPRISEGSTVEHLVEKEVRRYRMMHSRPPEPMPAEAPRPLITISRQCGSDGTELAQLVARKLGFDHWSQELVHHIAQNLGTRPELIETLDEKPRNRIDDLVAMSFGTGSTTLDYVRQVRRLVRVLADKGSAVVVGRGAQFVLGGDALRVRVVAPLDWRVENVMSRHGLDHDSAEAHLRAVDRARATFIRQNFGEDVDDPSHYDVVINMSLMTLDQAADMVLAAYAVEGR